MPEYKVLEWVLDCARFGADVRANRVRCGMTQAFLAAFLGYEGSYISKVERACPENISLRDFMRLCNLFDIDPRTYFVMEDEV